MSIPRSSSGRHFNTTATAGTVSFLPAMTAEEEKRRLQLYESEKDDELSSVSMSSASSSPIASTSRSVNPNNNNQQQQLQQSSLPENEEKPPSRAMVTFSVLFYLVAALVMVITTVLNHYMPREAEKSRLGWLQVMVNKWVLNSVRVPLFFLFVQLAIAVVLLHVSQMLGYFTIPHVHLSTCKGLLPLVSINVTGLIFNTYCLQYVDASFYQVARGLVLPFTVLFSYFLLSSRSSSLSLLAVGVVCVGFFLGVSSESLHASTTGTMLGVFSSLTTSVHAIVVKKSLNVVKGSTMDLVYYNNLLSAVLLSPLVLLSGESSIVVDMFLQGGSTLNTFIGGAVITGVFGFLICIAGFLSIKVTSPVTHMISSAVRGVIQTFLGMWCFGDIVTAGRGFGILFILLGSTLYTYAKEQEQRTKEAIASYGRVPPATRRDSNATTFSSSSPTQSLGHISPTNHKHPNFKKLAINTTSAGSPNGLTYGESAQESPRTPRSILNGPERAPGSGGGAASRVYSGGVPPIPRGLSPSQSEASLHGGNPNTARRLSYNGPPANVQNGQGHNKNISLTELKDIMISGPAKDRYKDEKLH